MKGTNVKRVVFFLLVGVTLGAIVYIAPAFMTKKFADQPAAHLTTGGSSVVYFIMDKWKKGFKEKEKDGEPIFIDFTSEGSKKGIQAMIDRKFDIGFTHAPMSDEQKKQAKETVLQIPVAISAIVPIYNVKVLNDKQPLNFTGDVLARIFLGEIKTWDDPAIKEINPALASVLPSAPIKVVYRSDSSGTSLIFAEYLGDVNEKWKGKAQDKIDWPVGTGAARSAGVVDLVKRTEGSIGYVEVLHARKNLIAYGAVENKDSMAKKDFKDKVFIHVKPENVTAAAKDIVKDIADDLTFKVTNRAGEKSYPICAGAWAVCYQTQPAGRLKMVSDFLTWVTHEGQQPAFNAFSYNATAKATLAKNDGKIKSLALTSKGFGYVKAPKVEITGGEGSGATATAEIARGQVVAVKITNPGSGYKTAPTVKFEEPEQELLFAPLPAELVQRVEKQLKTLKAVQ